MLSGSHEPGGQPYLLSTLVRWTVRQTQILTAVRMERERERFPTAARVHDRVKQRHRGFLCSVAAAAGGGVASEGFACYLAWPRIPSESIAKTELMGGGSRGHKTGIDSMGKNKLKIPPSLSRLMAFSSYRYRYPSIALVALQRGFQRSNRAKYSRGTHQR